MSIPSYANQLKLKIITTSLPHFVLLPPLSLHRYLSLQPLWALVVIQAPVPHHERGTSRHQNHRMVIVQSCGDQQGTGRTTIEDLF